MIDMILERFLKPVNSNTNSIISEKTRVLGGIYGLCVGDALGVPVEFEERAKLKKYPIRDMIGYGTHNQRPGTWSDDSSLTFCLMESLISGYDIDDIGKKLSSWYYNKLWAPYDIVFDIGVSTRMSLRRLNLGRSPKISGETDEFSNGNGSLMRILPLVFFLEDYPDDKFQIVEEVSAITHAHIRSKIACSIYIEVASNLLKGLSPYDSYKKMKPVIMEYYKDKGYEDELKHFSRILDDNVYKLKENEVKSGGYVIDTLEAGLWCLLRGKSYEDSVLKAVNLGGDTDTTGAVTGGLAGVYYGYDSIPGKWIMCLARKEDIRDLINRFYDNVYNNSSKHDSLTNKK